MKLRNLKLHIVVLVLLLVTFSLAIGQNRWEPQPDTPTSGGYGEAVVGTGSHIYLIREMYASSEPEFYRYDPIKNIWQNKSTQELPQGPFRNGTALAWDGGNNIYALLGARYKDLNRRLFYRYNMNKDNWKRLADTPHPQGAGDALTWSNWDKRLYAILGSNKHRTSFAQYNPVKNQWRKLSFPLWEEADDGSSLVWAGHEHLYFLSGESSESTPDKDFLSYHIPTDNWKKLASIPESQGMGDGGSLLWIGKWLPKSKDYIYALGGGSVDEKPGNTFYKYRISTNTWEELSSIPCPIGYYNGNRLGYANKRIYYWQGSPTSERFICGGDAFYNYTLEINNKPEFPNSKAIKPGESVSGFLDDAGAVDGWGDQDWWRMTGVSKGDEIIVKLTGPASADFDLCIWKDEDWSTCSQGSTSNEEIEDIAGSNTWIWVGAWVGKGNYNLTLKEKAQVVMNEIEQNPPCDDRYKTCMEWVEIYNPSETSVDISNWTVSTTGGKRTDTFQLYPQCSILKPNDYCVFGHSRWLDNNNESVILRDENRKEVDRTPVTSDNDNDSDSWQRCPNGKDTNSISDWQFRKSTREESNNC